MLKLLETRLPGDLSTLRSLRAVRALRLLRLLKVSKLKTIIQEMIASTGAPFVGPKKWFLEAVLVSCSCWPSLIPEC